MKNNGTPANLIEMLQKAAREVPDKIAYEFLSYDNNNKEKKRKVSYRELEESAKKVAVDLKKHGLKIGDRVLIFSTHTPDNAAAVFGAIYAGVAFTVIPPPIDEGKKIRFQSVIESAKPKLIMASSDMTEKLETAIYPKNLPKFVAAELVHFLKGFKIYNIDECISGSDVKADEWHMPKINDETLVCLQYSSGSTSTPKGVMISHGNYMSNLEYIRSLTLPPENLRFLGWVPFFHNIGLTVHIFYSIYLHGTNFVMSPLAFIGSPQRWLKNISKYKINATSGPNSAYEFCTQIVKNEEIEHLNLSSLQYAVCGSEPINFDTLNLFSKKMSAANLSKTALTPGYGLAECTTVVSVKKAGETLEYLSIDENALNKNKIVLLKKNSRDAKKIVSCGDLGEGMLAKIIDPETLQECKPDRIGELWIQSKSVALGYWNMPKETEETFKATLKNYPGHFLRTGDLGFIKENKLYITGRFKELIIINGKKFFSNDIEVHLKKTIPELRSLSIVSFSALIGNREELIICAELGNQSPVNFEQVTQKISSEMTKIYGFGPYDVLFIKAGSLPRTDNNKIKIGACKKLYDVHQLQTVHQLKGSSKDKKLSAGKAAMPKTKTEKTLLTIFSETLNNNGIGVTDNFFNIGGNSLTVTQLITKVEEKFKVKIPMRTFFAEPTIQKLAALVDFIKQHGSAENIGKHQTDLSKEISLPKDIQPEGKKVTVIKNVFLTGATGFLGAYLIREYLANKKLTMYCLVRAKTPQEGLERITKNMKLYKVWHDSYAPRIIPVLGDIGESRLGLKPKDYLQLAKTVDMVVHSAADLNFLFPYESLKKLNVEGSEEVMRLACKYKTKPYHHISSFSVYDNPSYFGKTAYENDPMNHWKGYYLGYSESKWVGEKKAMIARERGLPVTIFRPGEITGSSKSGIWQMKDMVCRFMVACIQMEAIPDFAFSVHITDVDYVAKAMTYISLQPQSRNQNYNLVNNKLMSLKDMAVMAGKFGYDVKLLSFNAWRKKLTHDIEGSKDNALKLLAPLFFEKRGGKENFSRRYNKGIIPKFDTSNTDNILKGTGIVCHPVDEKLMLTYFMYFIKSGYIKLPEHKFKAVREFLIDLL